VEEFRRHRRADSCLPECGQDRGVCEFGQRWLPRIPVFRIPLPCPLPSQLG
jgi:hypothetical protein